MKQMHAFIEFHAFAVDVAIMKGHKAHFLLGLLVHINASSYIILCNKNFVYLQVSSYLLDAGGTTYWFFGPHANRRVSGAEGKGKHLTARWVGMPVSRGTVPYWKGSSHSPTIPARL